MHPVLSATPITLFSPWRRKR